MRREVAEALACCGGGDEQLLGVGGKHLDRARAANSTLIGSPVLPASARYTGVVADALSPTTLPPAARRRASSDVIIVSGLLGVVGFDDPVPDYRLKMSAKLEPFGTMSRWWKPTLTVLLNEVLQGATVIDLLPAEHAAAWESDRSLNVLSVTFVDRTGKVAGHDAKAAKGRFARHLLCSTAGIEPRIKAFTDERFVPQIRERSRVKT
jgi:cytoplasmic iron level regulating protein YaaA (DUF328/UPF0246 family)